MLVDKCVCVCENGRASSTGNNLQIMFFIACSRGNVFIMWMDSILIEIAGACYSHSGRAMCICNTLQNICNGCNRIAFGSIGSLHPANDNNRSLHQMFELQRFMLRLLLSPIWNWYDSNMRFLFYSFALIQRRKKNLFKYWTSLIKFSLAQTEESFRWLVMHKNRESAMKRTQYFT